MNLILILAALLFVMDGNEHPIAIGVGRTWNFLLFVCVCSLRIMGSQNWWFGDPRTLRNTHPNPSISKGPMILRALKLEMTIQVFGL